MEERRAHKSQKQEKNPMILRPAFLKEAYHYPWLVILDRKGYTRQTFYNISHNRWYVHSIREMQNKLIVSSRQGWLFLKDIMTGDSSLVNMFTLEKLLLPWNFLKNHSSYVVLASCLEMDDACLILVIGRGGKKIRSCNLGDSKFVKGVLSYDSLGDIFAAVNFKGRLYVVVHGSWDLLVADFDDPQLHFTPIIRGDRLFTMMFKFTDDTKFHLIETSEEVFFVYTNRLHHDGWDIKIFKADLGRGEWVGVDTLGDAALLLDNYKGLSFSTPSRFGLRGNCVYYVNTFKDRNLYAYDIKDGRITTCLPCPIVSNEKSFMFWAM